MSPLQWLRELVMSWLGYSCKIVAVIFPLIASLNVLYIVFTDEFMSQHIILTLGLIVLFGFTCCLLTLSQVCVLRRRAHAADKSIDQLWDTDLKYENETEEVPYYKLSCHYKNAGTTFVNLFKNVFAFSKFRPAYGMALVTGLAAHLAYTVAYRSAKELSRKDDLCCVALELINPMILLTYLIFYIANFKFYIARRERDVYTPFEEFVQVPMKVVTGKTVAVFLTGGGTYWFLVIFLGSMTALSIISSNYLYRTPIIEDILTNVLPPIFPYPWKVLRTVLIITCVVLVNAMVGMIVSAFMEAKNSILCVIEKNWHRNLRAIAFLLGDTETETLQDLKNALDRKISQPLTVEEEKAFYYIRLPIWQTKTPFMLQKFEEEFPDLGILDEEYDDEDKLENIQPPSVTVKPKHKESTSAEQPGPSVAEVAEQPGPSVAEVAEQPGPSVAAKVAEQPRP